MTSRRSDIIGRQSVALRHLGRGDVGAALRAEFSPGSLSPEEAQSIIQAAELDTGVLGPIFESLTNPIVILGAALSFAFPVLKLRQMYGSVSKQIKKADQMGHMLPPGLREVMISPSTMLRTEPHLWDALLDVAHGRKVFYEKYIPRMMDDLEVYAKKAGSPLTEFHGRVVAASLDGLEKVHPKALKNFARPGINPKTGKAWSAKSIAGRMRSPFDTQKLTGHIDSQPGLREYVNSTRKVMDDVFDDLVVRHPEMRAELEAALTKKGRRLRVRQKRAIESGQLDTLDIPADVREYLKTSKRYKEVENKIRKSGTLELGDKLEDYWMHQLPRGVREIDTELVDLMREVSKQGLHGKRMSAGVSATVSESLMKRAGRMMPHLDDIKQFEGTGLLDDVAYKEMQQVVLSSAKDPAKHILPYSLEYAGSMQDYMHRMAATYAFNVRGAGRILNEGVDYLKKGQPGQQRIASVLEDTLIPLAAGKPDFQRAVRSQYWAGMQMRLQDSLKNGVLGQVVPKDLKKWMSDRLAPGGGPFVAGSLEGGLTDLMYSSTLGGNISSVLMNSMQTLITTVPFLGKHALDGIQRTLSKAPEYFKARVAGVPHFEAVQRAFPEFAEMGLGGMSKIVEGGLDQMQNAYRAATAGPLRRGFDKTNAFLMSLFEKAETMNQLVAFEGTMAKAASEGIRGTEALLAARRTVMLTQFPGGAVNAPIWVSKMKGHAGGRLAMMFSQFALRYPEFLISTATAAGSGVQAAGGRNWGTIGRAMLISGLAYEGGKAMGVDLSRGLMFGALPEPREDSPFYPWPMVSPALSIAGNLARDVLSGEFPEKSKYSLPLLVPGGVAGARAVGLVKYGAGAAEALGRKWIDYDSPGPGGTYPMYSEARSGATTLVGYSTLPQIMAQGLGLPVNTVSKQEPGAMEWLMKNRDRIREAKRQYLEAVNVNDQQEANSIDQQFQAAYPEVQGGLRALVQPRDMEAMQLRKDVSRMERVMDTLPREVRPIFAAALQASMLGGGSDWLGIPPGMLGTGTVKSREAARPGAFRSNNLGFSRGGGGFSRPGVFSGGGTGPMQGRSPGDISRYQLPKVGVNLGM